MIEENRFASFLFKGLLRFQRLQKSKIFGPFWQTVWDAALRRYPGPVSIKLHGKKILANNGHSYPLYARRFSRWNNPLIQLVHESSSVLARPIVFVDIGAGIGDTVLLIESNCAASVNKYVCIEGDAEFYRYLQSNLDQPERYVLHEAMLSSTDSTMPGLLRTHAGTASAQGSNVVPAIPFDKLIASSNIYPDVIKIDVDGYDGKVLAGMTQTLALHKPSLIFEWDPAHCVNTGNSWLEHFEILVRSNYTRFVWFTKYGDFSHFMTEVDDAAIKNLAELCLSGKHDYNWHYDIVALHRSSLVNDSHLALLEFAKRRHSYY